MRLDQDVLERSAWGCFGDLGSRPHDDQRDGLQSVWKLQGGSHGIFIKIADPGAGQSCRNSGKLRVTGGNGSVLYGVKRFATLAIAHGGAFRVGAEHQTERRFGQETLIAACRCSAVVATAIR